MSKQNPDGRGYASNVDRVRASGYSMGGVSDSGTPSDVHMVKGGFKKIRNTGKGGGYRQTGHAMAN